eukprot:TRINITY_DN39324_c0_g1_i1.p1 TRINITY_DN39324_c0_g1~~TRINITY_DN39324_c0_g1_i1.p1  ORF type:complete len:434 (+),score=84.26 TRINITY_DN39324_c0_g1_i1:211-1512(+)
MGNKIRYHPRVLLTDNTALNFKSASLVRDVFPIIEEWRRAGCDLAFDLATFQRTFNVVSDAERLFSVFDTDRNGLVDAHEVLMVYVLLSCGDEKRKVETVFEVFDFPGGGKTGSISFDEAMLLINACVSGLQKACGDLEFVIQDDELLFTCKGLFDMQRLQYDERLSREHFVEWAWTDVSPKYFVLLFHNAQGLPDIVAAVKRVNEEQGRVFQLLAKGRLCVSLNTLRTSSYFRNAIGNPSEEELKTIVDLMKEDESSAVDIEKYHAVLRPWNIFNECDLDGSGTLDQKEMEILLWIQMRSRPTREFVRDFVKSIDHNCDGDVSRQEWVEAILAGDRGRRSVTPLVDTSSEDDTMPGEIRMSAASRRRSVQEERRRMDSDLSPRRRSMEEPGRRRTSDRGSLRSRASTSLRRASQREHADQRSLLFAQVVSAG